MINPDAARDLEASLAEMDSRLISVIERALIGMDIMASDWHRRFTAEHVARAVWAWLAEGDE